MGGSFPSLSKHQTIFSLEEQSRPAGRIKLITSSRWTIKSNVEDHQVLQIIKVQKVNFGNNTAQHTRIGRDALDDLILAVMKHV
jgi:hypothetical protein